MRRSWLFLTFVVLCAGCQKKLDTERKPVDTGTLGETVYTLTCKRIAYKEDLVDGDGVVDVAGDKYRDACRHGTELPTDSYSSIRALHASRKGLIDAIDAIFPSAFLPELQAYLSSNEFLRLYDNGTVEKSTGKLVELFELLASDPDFAPALARLEGRLGYRPLAAAMGVVRAVAKYDGLEHLLKVLVDAISEGGSARKEFQGLARALARGLQNAEKTENPASSDRSLRLALGLLLDESAFLGTGRPHPLVQRDVRGLALVAQDPSTSQLPEPFADMDGDSFADADSMGRFIDESGQKVTAPSPFPTPEITDNAPARDDMGRALVAPAGPAMYRYRDLDRSLLGALLREAPKILDPQRGTGLNLLRGASALVGPRLLVRRGYASGGELEYRGYDTASSPLLDIIHGALSMVAYRDIDDTLALVRKLLVEHESQASRLFEAAMAVADLGDFYPSARLEPKTELFDDLAGVVNEILAVPGLAEDLMRALELPQVQELAKRFRDFMLYKDQINVDSSGSPYPLTGSLKTKVDRSQQDSGYNRSLMQRLLHLIYDSDGLEVCSKAGAVIKDPITNWITLATYDKRCDLMKIPNLAVFYLQSIVYLKDQNGNVVHDKKGRPVPKADLKLNLKPLGIAARLVTDDLLEDESGIDGFRHHPTPHALNRVLLVDPSPEFIANTMDPIVCKDGDTFIAAHNGTLPVWELNGFYDQIRPIAQAFADHEAEYLFIKVLSVLHTHYPSTKSLQHQPTGHGAAKRSNLQSYEPMLAEIIDKQDLWNAITEGSRVINQISIGSKKAPQVLIAAARYLFSAQDGLANRRGETATKTEGGTPVPKLSPWHLLADAYKAKRARLVEAGPEGEAWEGSTSELVDLLMRGIKTGSEWRFKNPRFRGIAVRLVDFLTARIAAHREKGDLTSWSREVLPSDAEEILSGPVFAGAADFVLSLQAIPEARAALEDLGAYLTDEAEQDPSFQASLTAAADIAQLFLDDPDVIPIARVAGKVLDPEFGLVDETLKFLQGARHADPTGTLVKIIRQALDERVPGRTSIGEIIDDICEVNRQAPWRDLGAPMTEGDFRAVFSALADFLGEEKRGLMKFIRIVKERNVDE
ncbi:MAG: hypothetical protein HY698_10395 [Deltaproteobacteria bacterium]|nr:hypothetical protein [Deltaproteobacteria bacterium]